MDNSTRDDLIVRIDERLSNHLDHHEKNELRLTRWLIALTVLVGCLVGNMVIAILF